MSCKRTDNANQAAKERAVKECDLPFLIVQRKAAAAARAAAFKDGMLASQVKAAACSVLLAACCLLTVLTHMVSMQLANSNVNEWVSRPGLLKTHDWKQMTGLVGSYMLQGLVAPKFHAVITRWFRIFSDLMRKELHTPDLPQLVDDAIHVLAELEHELPASECTILRHMLLHIADRARTSKRPPWAAAMWAWERMWGKAIRTLHQKTYPEAVVMKAFNKLLLARFW